MQSLCQTRLEELFLDYCKFVSNFVISSLQHQLYRFVRCAGRALANSRCIHELQAVYLRCHDNGYEQQLVQVIHQIPVGQLKAKNLFIF